LQDKSIVQQQSRGIRSVSMPIRIAKLTGKQPLCGTIPATLGAAPKAHLEKSLEVQESEDNGAKQKRISWAKLLSRVFALDMGNCDHCGCEMKAISAVIKQDVIVKILTHLGLPARAPPIAPSKISRQEEFWDQSSQYDEFSQLLTDQAQLAPLFLKP
jgi:hypothetical protein